jgi:hypothetical protein
MPWQVKPYQYHPNITGRSNSSVVKPHDGNIKHVSSVQAVDVGFGESVHATYDGQA